MPIGYWESELLLAPADLTVVGAGIVGMSTALHFKTLNPNARVRILERDMLGEGGTTRNAGFACFGSAGEWLDDRNRLGHDRWISLVEQRVRGLRTLLDLLGAEGIGLEWTGGWELFARTPEGQSKAAEALQAMDGINAAVLPLFQRFLPDSPAALQGLNALAPDQERALQLGASAAISLPWEGMIHTGKMVQSFHQALETQGIQRLHGCNVERIDRDPNAQSWSIRSPRGTMKSQKVAICTNGFARECVPGLKVHPEPNRVLVLTPEEAPPVGTYHLDDGYLYFRSLPGGQVLFGGGRHYGIQLPAWPALDREAEAVWDARLLESAEQWLGPIGEITHRWTGWLGVGPDRSPLLGSSEKGLFYGVRLGGMGVAIGCGMGLSLAELMSQERPLPQQG